MDTLEIKSNGPSAPVMSLSGGNQQKVVLAKLLAVEPKIILMYDITRGVDIGTKKEIFSLIKELADKGIAVLFYSTDMDELIHVCNDVIVMHDGMIKARLSDKYLTKENIMLASIGEECN
jgi:ABC-type sugar transport system ATPase subunit